MALSLHRHVQWAHPLFPDQLETRSNICILVVRLSINQLQPETQSLNIESRQARRKDRAAAALQRRCSALRGSCHLLFASRMVANTKLAIHKSCQHHCPDDEEAENASGTDAAGMISICIVRRKNIVLGKIGAEGRSGLQWATVKEIPLPGGAIFARRFADTLCIANATEYSLVHLSTGQITPLQLPISQTANRPRLRSDQASSRSGAANNQQRRKPLSAVDRSASSAHAKCEFLVTSHSGSITLGVFVKPSGEPAPKLLEWPSHPRSVTYDGKYLVSLLRNDTVEVHDLCRDSVEKVQTIQLPPGLDPRFLQSVQGPNQASGMDGSGTTSVSRDDLDFVKVSLGQLSSQETPVLRRASEHTGAASSSQSQILLCGRNSTSAVQQDPLLSWTLEQLHHGRLRTLRLSWNRTDQIQKSMRMRCAPLSKHRSPMLCSASNCCIAPTLSLLGISCVTPTSIRVCCSRCFPLCRMDRKRMPRPYCLILYSPASKS